MRARMTTPDADCKGEKLRAHSEAEQRAGSRSRPRGVGGPRRPPVILQA
jgi:hypothetical protein